jgi:HlyD family secretion protein
VTVARERIGDVIQTNGTLEPLPNGRATVAAEVAGRILNLSLQPGDRVTAGQVLASVFRSDLEAEAHKAAAAVAEVRRDVAALEAQLPLQEATVAAQTKQAAMALVEAQAKRDRVRAGSRPEEIERAEAQLASAQAELERLRSGPRPPEIRQVEAALRDADAEVELARRSAVRLTTLVEKGVAAAKERERAEADLARAQATQASAREALALLREGTRAEELRAQEARVRDAQAQVSLLRRGARPEEIREAEAAVAQAEAKRDEIEAQRQATVVLRTQIRAARERLRAAEAAAAAARSIARQTLIAAPISGIVSRVIAARGEVVQPGAPIAELESRQTLRSRLQVPAAYQARLRPGSPVTLSLPHQPGVRYTGRVRVIDPAVDVQTGTVTAEVWLANREGNLRSGMVVAAAVRGRDAAASLVIPSQSVSAMEGEQYVYRLDSVEPTIHRTNVRLGVEWNGKVQVLEGLRAGDRILRDGHRSLADESPYQMEKG